MITAILGANITEDQLIDNAMRGDLEAFNQLVETYQDIAFHHAWTYMNDPQLAEDVTQESFIKAFQAIKRFRKGSFKAWILRIVANTAYDALRRNKRQKLIPLFPEKDDGSMNKNPSWLIDSSPSIEETVIAKETGSEIYSMLQELPEIYREVLTLIDIYDFEYKKAAEVLNIKVGTVKSRLMRARLQLRNKIKYFSDPQANPNARKQSDQLKNKQNLKLVRQLGWSHV